MDMILLLIFGAAALGLMIALGVLLRGLSPPIIKAQLSFSEKAFYDVVERWSPSQRATVQRHFALDYAFLVAYGGSGWFLARELVQCHGLTLELVARGWPWLLPVAAVCDAIENMLHQRFLRQPRGAVMPSLFRVSGCAAALKWTLVLLYGLVFLAWAGLLSVSTALADSRKVPFLLQFTHEVAETAGIGRLDATPISAGASEIRVWLGFGTVIPAEMLRLQVDEEGVVSGQVLIHFPADLSFMEAGRATKFREKVSGYCADFRSGPESEVCTANFGDEPDWHALHDALIRMGITLLPDESELPKPEFEVTDGMAVVVEVRNGEAYRAYGYSNPGFRSEPEAEAATRIIESVSEVFNQAAKGQ